jgi:putative membrane protein
VRIPTPVAQIIRGFTMGSADIVPGASGGTVALVLGIYDQLIRNISQGAHSLKQLFTGDVAGCVDTLKRIEWVWLLTLLAGILAAILALSSVIETLLHDEPIKMSALFFGLILGSIWVALRMLDKIDDVSVALMLGIGLTMFLLLGLRSDTEVADTALEVVTEPLWAFFLAGAIAICAMILPGISGSFILVMLGMYTEVLGAVNDRDYTALIALMLGCVVGLALFSTLLNWLLERYHRWVLAAMIGLMIGSTRVLWPWPNGTNTTTMTLPRDDVVIPLLIIVVGAAVVVIVDLLAVRYVHVDPLPEHEAAAEPTR